MKNLLLITLLFFAVSGFSQMRVNTEVTYKETAWTDLCVSLGVYSVDSRNSTISIPVYFYKDIQSLAGGDENRIGQEFISITFMGLHPQCSEVENALKAYLGEYFSISESQVVTIQFCE
jgi:hypothetical protein